MAWETARTGAMAVAAGRGPTRRRLLGTSLSAGGVMTLAACGQQGAGQAPAAGGAPKGKALFWQWGAGYVDGFKVLVKEYNDKNSGVTIDFDESAVTSGSSDYWQKLTAAVAGNVAPDVFLMNTNARTWGSQGLLRQVDDLVKKDKAANDLLQAANKAFAQWYDFGGKQLGWPWDYSTIVTYYNVGLLREAGLKPPAELGDKWDWNAFREYAQKLTKPGSRWGVLPDYGDESGWLNFVRANGGDYLSEDRKKCLLGSPQAIEAMEFLVGLVQKDKVMPTRAEYSAAGGVKPDLFVNGVVAMPIHGDWQMTDITKKASSTLEWDVAPVPFKNGKTGSSANLRSLVINTQTKNVEQSFDFMKFMLTKPVQDRIPKLFGEVPARLDSANEVYASYEKAGPPKGRSTLKASIQATKALPAADRTPPADFRGLANALINDAWDGKIAVKDAMTQAQEQINNLLAKNGG